MKKTNLKKILSLMLCVVLIAAMALLAGCGENPEEEALTKVVTDGAVVGEGAVSFPLVITDGEGNVVNVTVNTDEKTVGAALLAVELIAGEESEFGLYIKTVNGITADYDVDKTYWGFYIDGEYAMTGVDATEIVEGSTYSLTVEKGE